MPVRMHGIGSEAIPRAGSSGRDGSGRDPGRWNLALACGGGSATLLALTLGSAGYWRYANSVPPFVPPPQAMPQPNGYLRAAAVLPRLAVGLNAKLPPGWPRVGAPDLRARIGPAAPALDQLRGSLRLEWRMSPTQTPPNFRAAALLFVAESRLAASEGPIPVAFHRALDALELASKIPHGGNAWTAGMALSCHNPGYEEAEALAPRLPASALPDALARVRRIRRNWPSTAEILEGQRVEDLAETTAGLRQLTEQPFWHQARDLWDERNVFGPAETVAFALTPKQQFLTSLDEYQGRIAASRKPLSAQSAAGWNGPPWLQSGMNAPPSLEWDWARMQTQLSLLEVTLAVHLHQHRHREYPRAPSEIDPAILPQIQLDPWGSRITWRLAGDRVVLYSLGPDGKDDAGMAVKPFPLGPTTRGDLVFGHLSRRAWRPAPGKRR